MTRELKIIDCEMGIPLYVREWGGGGACGFEVRIIWRVLSLTLVMSVLRFCFCCSRVEPFTCKKARTANGKNTGPLVIWSPHYVVGSQCGNS
jgi:hypothetical protein